MIDERLDELLDKLSNPHRELLSEVPKPDLHNLLEALDDLIQNGGTRDEHKGLRAALLPLNSDPIKRGDIYYAARLVYFLSLSEREIADWGAEPGASLEELQEAKLVFKRPGGWFSGETHQGREDLIDAGLDALDLLRRGHVAQAHRAIRSYVHGYLGLTLPREVDIDVLMEAVWRVLQGVVEHGPGNPLDPPTARKDDEFPLADPPKVHSYWEEPPRKFRETIGTAVLTEMKKHHARFGEDRFTLGAEDRDRLEVDRRAAQRLERGVDWERGEHVVVDEDVDAQWSQPAINNPEGMARRSLRRFTRDERERLYLDLLGRMKKVDAQREAGLERTQTIALAARIQRDPRIRRDR